MVRKGQSEYRLKRKLIFKGLSVRPSQRYRQDRRLTRVCREEINLNYTTDKTCSMSLLECN